MKHVINWFLYIILFIVFMSLPSTIEFLIWGWKKLKYIKDGIFEAEKAKKAINLSEDVYELLVIFGNIYNEILSEENRMTMIRKLELCSYYTTLTNDRIRDIFYTNILTN